MTPSPGSEVLVHTVGLDMLEKVTHVKLLLKIFMIYDFYERNLIQVI